MSDSGGITYCVNGTDPPLPHAEYRAKVLATCSELTNTFNSGFGFGMGINMDGTLNKPDVVEAGRNAASSYRETLNALWNWNPPKSLDKKWVTARKAGDDWLAEADRWPKHVQATMPDRIPIMQLGKPSDPFNRGRLRLGHALTDLAGEKCTIEADRK